MSWVALLFLYCWLKVLKVFPGCACSVCNDVFSEATTQTHFWVLQLPEQLVHTQH